jgi:hypothetical protein
MERNSTIGAWRLPGGINSAADKGVSVMILSYHDSVPPTFADKQVNAYEGRGAHPRNNDPPLPGPLLPWGGADARFGRLMAPIRVPILEIPLAMNPSTPNPDKRQR